MNFPSLEAFRLDLNTSSRCGGVPSAIFLASSSEKKVMDYMSKYYDGVFPIVMDNTEIPLYYLPENLKKGHLYDCLKYNNPSLVIPESRVYEIADKFKSRIMGLNNLDSAACGIALMDFNDPTSILDFYPIDPKRDLSPQLNGWMSYLLSKILMKHFSVGNPMMSQGKVSKCGDDIVVDIPTLARIVFSKDLTPRPSDENFDEMGYQLAKEIKQKINILKERGFMKLVTEILEEMQELSVQMSRIRVTADYRIFLIDWGNREVLMAPLPKTIFLLYLNHPEGILFKELIEYKEEMEDIYKRITLRENIDDIQSSIDALVDPMNNSINEKCSRIRAAFLDVVAPELASSYYISGKRAEAKKIKIDRNLVLQEVLSGK